MRDKRAKAEPAHYTPYSSVEASPGRIGLVSCLRCGACIIVGDPDFDAAAVHDEWHRKVVTLD